MLKNLNSYLHDFISVRTDGIGSSVLMKHAEYRQLSDELQLIFKEILKSVPVDQRQMMFDYEEKENARMAVTVEMMYRQGVVDGVYLHRRLSAAALMNE